MKENQRIVLTKKMLKSALQEILTEKTIYKVSVHELCEKAGINRSTFYKHYDNQFDLLLEMEHDLIDVITNQLKMPALSNQDLQLQLESILKTLEDNIGFSALLINNNLDPNFPKMVFSAEPVKKPILDGLAKRFDKEEIPYVFSFVVAGTFEMIKVWINSTKRLPIKMFAKTLISVINEITLQL